MGTGKMRLVSNKISQVCSYVEQTFSQMEDLFEVLNESEHYLAMNPEKLTWVFRDICDSWREILGELNHLRNEKFFSCVDTNLKGTLEDCIQESEKVLPVVEALNDTLSQAYYEYEASGTSAPLCMWQSKYCRKYPYVKNTNMQLVKKLNLIQHEILHIEEIMSS